MAKILICTGIYPPQVGGPAQYAKEVADEFRRQGYVVKVLTYVLERKLPTFIRHGLFFLRTFFSLGGVDFVFALDMFSVGMPAVLAAKLCGKKTVIRTGGDFLWETYVERTGDLVLLKNFYQQSRSNFNLKEKIIFWVTRWALQKADAVIFSTHWQRKIFEQAYELAPEKNFIVENFYGQKSPAPENQSVAKSADTRMFVAGTRPLKWKNIERLQQVFAEAKKEVAGSGQPIELDIAGAPYAQFFEKIRQAYAIILVSLGDISPNMILDALQTNTPFILTRETGLYDRLQNVGLFVDPENSEDIKEKILYLADPANYRIAKEKIENFNFTHSWREICEEILAVAQIV